MDDFFDHERTFLLEYHTRIRDACLRADRVMHSHKCTRMDPYLPLSQGVCSVLGTSWVGLSTQMDSDSCSPTGLADDYIPISAALSSLGTQEVNQLKM